ncbi:MAG TPA: glycosyltransferase family 2 protein [Terriglobales bacterium]|nr:glycosyltransferase family 2 protein [Terriglobales bacterium]
MRWMFWLSAGVLGYMYAGYGLWLWLRSFLRPRPIDRAPSLPSLSLVMVVRNEERYLEEKLRRLLELDYCAERCQVVVVSDGSTDRTEAILRDFAVHPRVCAILNALAAGKASGVNDAMAWAQGELIVFTDARQTIEPGAIRLLAENFADPAVGCASGELMLGSPDSGEAAQGMGLYWKIEKKIRELESASGSVVGATGALYAVRRELVPPLPPGMILDDVYIPMQVARQGFRVVFDGRARAWDLPHQGREREFGRKVRTLTGNYQLLQLAPWLLRRENPVRFEFVSHKLLRLLAPFALAAALISSVFLAAPVYRAALVCQILFYLLATLGITQRNHGPLTRMTDAAFTFVMLNTAALIAFANFVTGRKQAWVR